MKNIKTLRGLQDELALLHAALVIGYGYDVLKERTPQAYRALHDLLLVNMKNVNARRPVPRGKR